MKIIKNNSESGFTLIEAVIGAAVFSMVAVALYFLLADIMDFNRVISGNLWTQDQMRRGMRDFSSEARSASPSSLGAYSIAEASNFSFTFYSDIDGDPLKEQIRYFLEGDVFKKGVIKPSGSPLVYDLANEEITVLANNIVNDSVPIFNYYDSDYDGTTLPLSSPVYLSAVRLVKITIIAENARKSSEPITLTTQVSMRNLKDNL